MIAKIIYLCECGKKLSKKKYKRCQSCNLKARWSNSQFKLQANKKIFKAKKALFEYEETKRQSIAEMQLIAKLPWLSKEMIKNWHSSSFKETAFNAVKKNINNFWTSSKYEGEKNLLSEQSLESLKALWQNTEYRENILKILSEGITDKHLKLEKSYEQTLFDYGFLSSEIFDNYIVDYCDKFHKIIIEIYEDFWHCNPNKWKEDDINPLMLKTAKEIWAKDQEKIDFLISKGYKVHTLWESELKNLSIEKLLTEKLNLISNVKDEFRGFSKEEILAKLSKNKTKLSVLFENWQGDYNFSTGIRNSNAFNIEKVYFISNKKKWDKRGALGAHHYCDLNHISNLEEIKALKKNYVFIGVDCVSGSIPMESFEWPKNTLMIFGEEGQGISSEILSLCDNIVHITQFGSIRSLNVGTASGIAMYDFIRKSHK